MLRTRPLLVPVALTTAVAACAVGLSAASAASADDDRHRRDGRDLLRSGLVGSTPATPAPGGPELFGASPGGAPWVVAPQSSVRVRSDGRVEVKIRGLVIPPPVGDGTNPSAVSTVSASVVCNGAQVADSPRTPVSPIDRAGDARIRAHVALPSPCLAPAVLVHPNGRPGVYIAASGG